ncbi:MAG: response regulator, partial [Alphaproteobacteria bacterium]
VMPSAAAKGVTLDLQLTISSQICGDPMRLQQVTWNLISNAIKFSPDDGTVTIRTFSNQVGGEEWAVLEVSDEGVGIGADFLPHVFDRFRQADGSTTRRYGGLGLGLAIVKNVVELHGGRVSVSSDGTGRGTTFRAELPLSKGDCDIREDAGEPTALDWSRLRVLCVDDHVEAREWMRLTLSRRGAQVEIASTMDEALEKLTSWRPHIALCDIGMPDNDGYDLLQAIHDRELPIAAIAITGFAFPGERDRAREAGFQEFLAKPVEDERLFRAVESIASERIPR